MLSAVLQGAPQLGYLGTTASSRAKLSQAPPTSGQEEEKENLYSSDLQPAGVDVSSSTSAAPQTRRYRTGTSPHAVLFPLFHFELLELNAVSSQRRFFIPDVSA